MLAWLVAELWGSELVAVHGTVLRPAELPGFIAERSRRVVGLLTYQLVGDMLEIVTLNAIERRVGIGTMLIEAAAGTARHLAAARSGSPPPTTTSTRSASTSAAGSGSPNCGRARSTAPGRRSPRSRGSATTASRCTTRSTSPCGSRLRLP